MRYSVVISKKTNLFCKELGKFITLSKYGNAESLKSKYIHEKIPIVIVEKAKKTSLDTGMHNRAIIACTT